MLSRYEGKLVIYRPEVVFRHVNVPRVKVLDAAPRAELALLRIVVSLLAPLWLAFARHVVASLSRRFSS